MEQSIKTSICWHLNSYNFQKSRRNDLSDSWNESSLKFVPLKSLITFAPSSVWQTGISHLSKSSLPQHSILSESVFSDWLPDKTQTQENPLIHAHILYYWLGQRYYLQNSIPSWVCFLCMGWGLLRAILLSRQRIWSRMLWEPAVYLELHLIWCSLCIRDVPAKSDQLLFGASTSQL